MHFLQLYYRGKENKLLTLRKLPLFTQQEKCHIIAGIKAHLCLLVWIGFFYYPKLYFLKKVQQLQPPWEVMVRKGDTHIPLQTHKGKEVKYMKSSFEQAIEAQFDCLTKKVIKTTVKKHQRDLLRRHHREIAFSDISTLNLSSSDTYSHEYEVFNVLGIEIQVADEQLSKALKTLPDKKRNIILLSYFMDLSDSEIGELLHLVRSTIYRHRTSTLEELKKRMED